MTVHFNKFNQMEKFSGRRETPFLSLSRHKRKQMCIHVKRNIVYGPYFNFHSYEDMDYKGIYPSSGHDIYFCSKKCPDIYYNCVISTGYSVMGELIQEKTRQIIDSKMTDDDMSEILKNECRPVKWGKYGKPVLFELIFNDKKYPQLDNMTYFEYWRKLEQDMWHDIPEDLVVDLGYTAHYDWSDGIGLLITIPEYHVSSSKIYEIVDEFLSDYEDIVLDESKSGKEEYVIRTGTMTNKDFLPLYLSHMYYLYRDLDNTQLKEYLAEQIRVRCIASTSDEILSKYSSDLDIEVTRIHNFISQWIVDGRSLSEFDTECKEFMSCLSLMRYCR